MAKYLFSGRRVYWFGGGRHQWYPAFFAIGSWPLKICVAAARGVAKFADKILAGVVGLALIVGDQMRQLFKETLWKHLIHPQTISKYRCAPTRGSVRLTYGS